MPQTKSAARGETPKAACKSLSATEIIADSVRPVNDTSRDEWTCRSCQRPILPGETIGRAAGDGRRR